MDADALSDCHIGTALTALLHSRGRAPVAIFRTALPAIPPSRGGAPVAFFCRAYDHNGFDGIAIVLARRIRHAVGRVPSLRGAPV